MRLFNAEHWLHAPTNREIIARWSPLSNNTALPLGQQHRLEIQGMLTGDSRAWEFLVLGDTGDSDASGPGPAPQDAVARELARDAIAPVGVGQGQLVLHTGDVIYMAGERRLYERNFRRPYAPFLTPESTADNLTFRLPFLPVPGNHDYYDLGGWMHWLSRVPLLRRGLRTISHRFFGFGIPEGGSDMGRAFMEAFVAPPSTDRSADSATLPYTLSQQTRLPHRYYQFEQGGIDFFALDSNTLDSPSSAVSQEAVRAAADQRIAILEREAREVDALLQQEQKAHEAAQQAARQQMTAGSMQQSEFLTLLEEAQQALDTLTARLTDAAQNNIAVTGEGSKAQREVAAAAKAWQAGRDTLLAAQETTGVTNALATLDTVGDAVCQALSQVQTLLSQLPAGGTRNLVTAASDTVEQTQSRWAASVTPPSWEREQKLRALSEKALDLQRELALEKTRQHYQPEDHDAAQLAWFAAALEEAERVRPGNWRVVFLHHPLYTTIVNHCERPDVRGLRANLMHLLQPGRVHLILSGHAHAFEWIRTNALPTTGIFVSGGGGQVALRSSVFTSRQRERSRRRRGALREAGVTECAIGGRGPTADDGEMGLLYHYLRIVVRPDALQVHPIGVRALRAVNDGERLFRREEAMPVYHAADISPRPEEQERPAVRRLQYVEIRRDRPPEAHWQ